MFLHIKLKIDELHLYTAKGIGLIGGKTLMEKYGFDWYIYHKISKFPVI